MKLTPSIPGPRCRSRGGFTLVEMMCATVVIGVSAATVAPAIFSATTAAANAARVRGAVNGLAYAMDRTIGLLRDVPASKTDATAVDVASASTTGVKFGDGRSLLLDSGVLVMVDAKGDKAPLLRDVTNFRIDYLDQAGVADVSASPGKTWVFGVSITASGVTLSGRAFARARMVGG